MQKTILITGSTDGIGKLAAIQLAMAGHNIYLHGRNAQKLERVIEEVKQASNNQSINGFVADFSDLKMVKKIGQQIKSQLPKIDVLLNNAGIFKSPTTFNANGLDIRLVVNYLAPYLLTNALMPLLEKATAPRIINLSSAAQDSVSLEVLKGKQKTSERIAYGQSKLALTMWSFYLAKKLKNITVIPVNPGSLLNTNMVKEAFGQFWASADKGANILYDLATASIYQNATGQYFDNDRGTFGMAHPDAYNEYKIQQLIHTTEEIVNN